MTCGIYKIVNNKTNKIYVGSSKNIEVRIQGHLSNLKNKKHHSVKLQNSYNKHGPKCFTYEVLEECEIEDLFAREQVWIDSLDSYHSGYNASESSIYPTNKHSLRILDKNSKHIENIIYNLVEIQDMRDSIPTDIVVSCESLGAAASGKLKFIRYLRATEMLKNLLEDIAILPKDCEYTITKLSYGANSIRKYELKPVGPKYWLINKHNLLKSDYFYDQLIQIYINEISYDKYGRWILEEMSRRGIGFDPFRVDLKTQ